MPRFNVLYIVEYDHDNKKPNHLKSDNRLIILFDEFEDSFYCYGTRRRVEDVSLDNNRYIDYQSLFSSENNTTLLNWVKLLNNKFFAKYTIEFHQIVLEDYEYEGLHFEALFNKLSRYNELFAYDQIVETEGSFLEKIDMLTSLANF